MGDAAKALIPYLQRADEMQKHDRRVAYYCRMFALETGIALPERTADTNALLGALMKQLEEDKPSAGLGDDDALHMEGFALKIFGKADALDRAGRADAATAKALYASSVFFEVLRQFGELAPDLAAKQRYAAWRAAEIRSALKEGRQPAAPPGADEAAAAVAASEATAAAALDDLPRPPPGLPAPHTPPRAPASPPPAGLSPSAAAAGVPFSPPVDRGRPSLTPGPSPPPGLKSPVLTDVPAAPSASGLPTAALVEAQRAAKVAASALSFDDVPTAVAHLRQALAALGASERG